jgi:hypothetical protein
MTPLPGELVDLPLPPELARALGFSQGCRFAGFFWAKHGNEAVASYGIRSHPAHSQAFLIYRHHPAVAPLLARFDLGSAQREATQILLIDKEANRASIADLEEGIEFLKANNGYSVEQKTGHILWVEKEEFRRMRESLDVKHDFGQIERDVKEQTGHVKRMASWLDLCPEPPRGQSPS